MSKIPFLDRLTGALAADDYDDLFEDNNRNNSKATDNDELRVKQYDSDVEPIENEDETNNLPETDTREGELSVDVYQTADEIVVRALVAGVTPTNLDISLTRDMITIKGTREENVETEEDNYFYQELYWGSFTRTILLPEEVEVDEATANENHGILIIRLPKINKARKTKLKVKSR